MLSISWSMAFLLVAFRKYSLGCPDFRLVLTLETAEVLEFSLGTKERAYGPCGELEYPMVGPKSSDWYLYKRKMRDIWAQTQEETQE